MNHSNVPGFLLCVLAVWLSTSAVSALGNRYAFEEVSWSRQGTCLLAKARLSGGEGGKGLAYLVVTDQTTELFWMQRKGNPGDGSMVESVSRQLCEERTHRLAKALARCGFRRILGHRDRCSQARRDGLVTVRHLQPSRWTQGKAKPPATMRGQKHSVAAKEARLRIAIARLKQDSGRVSPAAGKTHDHLVVHLRDREVFRSPGFSSIDAITPWLSPDKGVLVVRVSLSKGDQLLFPLRLSDDKKSPTAKTLPFSLD